MEPLVLDGELCAGAGCRGGGRPRTADGRKLCAACGGRLAEGLRELPRLHADCGVALGAGAAGGLREKTTGGALPGLVLNGRAAEARTGIVTTLASWSGLVAEERRRRAPVREVGALADFLLANLTWLTCHPAAADLSAEVSRTVRTARRAAYPDPVKQVVVGPCVTPACDGVLTATVRGGEGARVRCGADPGHTWDGPEWILLRREMRRSASTEERWLTAADIAALWSTPTGTVYRLAGEQGWRRVTRSGRTYYAENDVHGCFSRRKARVSRGK
ncbi:hypothetical protein ACQPZF_23365 [Actinosynnema sp. CS-041913]|uniref:hypothetical protein n=1 Tax=Actinosynnema sp. CS-041913 TaxID=3239917 RepID=UPI003D9405EC